MVLKLCSFLVAVQEAHFVPNFSKCSTIWSYFFLNAVYSNSLNVFPLSWATWCMTCNWHTSFSSFWLSSFSGCVSLSSSKHFTWSTKSPRYSARPPVVPWVYCWFASSLLLVTECTRKEITIFYHFSDTAWRLKHSFLKLCATCHYCHFYPRTDRSA